jgi:hypothetical protein
MAGNDIVKSKLPGSIEAGSYHRGTVDRAQGYLQVFDRGCERTGILYRNLPGRSAATSG